MRNSPFWWILIGFMVLLDIYFFQSVKVVAHPVSNRLRTIIFAVYWTISGSAIITLLILPYMHFEHQARLFKTTIFAIVAGLFFAKIIASAFFLVDDIRRGLQWIVGKLFHLNSENEITANG